MNLRKFYNLQHSDEWTGCVEWMGGKDKNGYGMFYDEGKTHKAHRIAYLLHYGNIPNGLCVCHSCDNSSCVNPYHLWAGTAGQNNKDRHQKGRSRNNQAPGEGHHMAKLTEEVVLSIRQDKRPLKEISQEYNISMCQVSRIRNKKVWTYLDKAIQSMV